MIDPDAFLRQEVESASPAKLRWLLIRKALGLCQVVGQMWEEGRTTEAGQWMLRVREIFGELLEGVTDPKHPTAKAVSDLYTFLLKALSKVEQNRDPKGLKDIIDILHIELETWGLFVHNESRSSDFNFGAPSTPAPTGRMGGYAATEWAGLNVEA
ncbi:MAG: flagellar export chaperone FliS [Pirellulaceae bacterium]|nr:flagellar export chaperone FliS [Pirellulaceae bacterium]